MSAISAKLEFEGIAMPIQQQYIESEGKEMHIALVAVKQADHRIEFCIEINQYPFFSSSDLAHAMLLYEIIRDHIFEYDITHTFTIFKY